MLKGVSKMSLIIDLFVLVYLTAIVLASILSIVWILSLLFEFVSVMRNGYRYRRTQTS